MNVIVHQNESVNGNAVFKAGFTQQSSGVMAILVVNEDRRPIHTTLDDMKRNMWQDQACATGHGMKPNRWGVQSPLPLRHEKSGKAGRQCSEISLLLPSHLILPSPLILRPARVQHRADRDQPIPAVVAHV